MYMDIYEESTLYAAINTYRVLILGDDVYDIIDGFSVSYFLFDLSNYPYISNEYKIYGAQYALKIFEEHEHYEKCADLRDYIKQLKNEVKGDI